MDGQAYDGSQLGCDEALAHFEQFSAAELPGQDARRLMPEVAAHPKHCPDCAADFQVLLERLTTISAPPRSPTTSHLTRGLQQLRAARSFA